MSEISMKIQNIFIFNIKYNYDSIERQNLNTIQPVDASVGDSSCSPSFFTPTHIKLPNSKWIPAESLLGTFTAPDSDPSPTT